MTALRILLIDDHALFRSGMKLVLQGGLPGVQVFEADCMEQVMGKWTEPSPSLVLLDLQMKGMDGMEGLLLLKKRWPDVPVIMLSSAAEPEVINSALSNGAAAFFSKAGTAQKIIMLIDVALGTSHAKPSADDTRPALTARQSQVLSLLDQGLSNKAIARRLDLSEFTVRCHVQAVLISLGVSSRLQAITAARGAGLLV